MFGKDKLANLNILKPFLFNLACLKLKEANSPLYEDFIKAITKTLISSRIKKDSDSNTAVWTPQQSLPLKTCSKILVKLLEESDGTDSSRDHLSNGLLVDWYEIVDPEIVHVHPLLQRQLLFQDRESMPSGDRSLTGHEERSPSKYLLSLLAHQACWETLQDCLDWLLGQNDRGNRYELENQESARSCLKTKSRNNKLVSESCYPANDSLGRLECNDVVAYRERMYRFVYFKAKSNNCFGFCVDLLPLSSTLARQRSKVYRCGQSRNQFCKRTFLLKLIVKLWECGISCCELSPSTLPFSFIICHIFSL